MDLGPLKRAKDRVLRNRAVRLVVATFQQFLADRAPRLAAALSYYALFSLAPLLLFSITIAGLVFGTEEVREEVRAGMAGLMGEAGARMVDAMIEAKNRPGESFVGSAIGLVILFLGASGVFYQLQEAFDTIWNVERKGRSGWRNFVKDRVLSLGMVLATAFLLVTSLVLTAVLTLIRRSAEAVLPGGGALWTALNLTLALAFVTLVFAALFRYLPEKRPAWRHVWVGALLTAVLFDLGQLLIGHYISRSSFAAAYGLASAVLAILVWFYFTSLIVFFGGEFTQVWSESRRSPGTFQARTRAPRARPRGRASAG